MTQVCIHACGHMAQPCITVFICLEKQMFLKVQPLKSKSMSAQIINSMIWTKKKNQTKNYEMKKSK